MHAGYILSQLSHTLSSFYLLFMKQASHRVAQTDLESGVLSASASRIAENSAKRH